jgi:hypothetical protein
VRLADIGGPTFRWATNIENQGYDEALPDRTDQSSTRLN